MVELPPKAGPDADAQDEAYDKVLQTAVSQSFKRMIELLLKAGADAQNEDVLQEVLAKGYEEIFELLLETNAQNWGAVRVASSKGHGKIVKLLLKAGANVDAYDKYGTALLGAS